MSAAVGEVGVRSIALPELEGAGADGAASFFILDLTSVDPVGRIQCGRLVPCLIGLIGLIGQGCRCAM